MNWANNYVFQKPTLLRVASNSIQLANSNYVVTHTQEAEGYAPIRKTTRLMRGSKKPTAMRRKKKHPSL